MSNSQLIKKRVIDIYFVLYLAALIFLLPGPQNNNEPQNASNNSVPEQALMLYPEKTTLICTVLPSDSGNKIISLDSINTIYYTSFVNDINFEFIVEDQSIGSMKSNMYNEAKDNLLRTILTTMEEINYLLRFTGRGNLSFCHVMTVQSVNERLLIDIDVRDRKTVAMKRLHIDVTKGAPTFEQVADCIYGSGADADQKLILYHDEYDSGFNSHPGHSYLVAGFG